MPTRTDAGFAPGFTDTWMRRFAACASATEAELSALDQQVGDGDFGANLVAGLQATLSRLGADDGTATAGAPLDAAAAAFLDEVGGTSGPLFGLLFQEMAAAVAAAGDALNLGALAAGVGNGLAAIQRVGEASVGDKTLIDALAPACAALTSYPPDADPAEALSRAARAAWGGVADTARLTARRGRASYLGDRAAGVPDPGAVGIGLLFSTAEQPVTRLAPFLPGAERTA
ncbi:dihydroxyacetone kinase subunit DhaL [Actinacidiphila sp. ITFR-21]|uniref:dihydroxyacetone kinase subunit DhaL n=1 Tax=Actinacidiphila sp. ITFR-21 TaxID=3075199 RepID=UPI00288AC915|nr:dihydroxyacetone kinase subunit DhaL [Streptomyces sp. ITFR-21]WNI17980.1 dihydroxyacetone kinase subunit DhaL [Streptomyces sp. ITFR-21]